MDEPKWTPGPWAAIRHGAVVGGPEFSFAQGSGRKQIAMACVVPEGVDGDKDANAALIAAAPDLYAALDELLRVVEATEKAIFDRSLGLLPSEAEHEAAINRARDALAAVRGEQR